MGGSGTFYYQYAIHKKYKREGDVEKVIPSLILLDREQVYTGRLDKNKWEAI